MFNPRELRHRIDIERKVEGRNPTTGEVTESWELVVGNVPAKIAPLSTREFFASQAAQSNVSVRITIRYRPGLTASMRIVHNGVVYNPEGWFADPDSNLKYLSAPCSSGVNQG